MNGDDKFYLLMAAMWGISGFAFMVMSMLGHSTDGLFDTGHRSLCVAAIILCIRDSKLEH